MLDFAVRDSSETKLWMMGGSTDTVDQNFSEVPNDVWFYNHNAGTKEWTRNIRLTVPYPAPNPNE